MPEGDGCLSGSVGAYVGIWSWQRNGLAEEWVSHGGREMAGSFSTRPIADGMRRETDAGS